MHQAAITTTTTTVTTAAAYAVGKKIIELVSNGSLNEEALVLYKQLHSHGSHGAPSFLPSLVKACSSSPRSLPFALQLHCVLLKTGLASDLVTTNSLISMYSKHSHVRSARLLFDTSLPRDAVTWQTMISCYVTNGCPFESMEMFRAMYSSGFLPKPELTAAVLSVCGRAGVLGLGRAVHALCTVTEQFESCAYLPTSLVDMYSRCHDLDAALKVFGMMPDKNVVSWTAMIVGSVLNERYDMSINLFQEMGIQGIKPNRATLVSLLPACGELGALDHGKRIHGYILRHGFQSEPQIIGALIHMYGRCKGAFKLASLVYERADAKDVVTWSSMMMTSNRNGDFIRTLQLFQMMQNDGVKVNHVTMLAVIAACIGLSSTNLGEALHGYILKSGLLSEVHMGNSLIDMYAKCGCLWSSVCTFAEMQEKDLVSYSSMIASYGLQGYGHHALKLFNEMLDMRIQPDGITLLAVLSACNHSGLVNEGKELFDTVRRKHSSLSLEHYACLTDLLGRSGRFEDACEVIRNMPMKPSPKILSSLISACRIACRSEAAKKLALWLIDAEPENAANYTLLSVICAESGDWFQVEEIRRQMRMSGMKKTAGVSQIVETNGTLLCIG
ncbi:hypothetical protein OPV22_032366 [Ensete ventricosum]|uniref:Pentacotripeptide-repeat region of PRORP domain-containing protein n=1 Tax=Ensete ventricosum TaxID=4639 RepID=A0AAV8PPE9_ENSVE|nr:hypothetical protein OPV22_032366 [Ensete ventricosum]